MGMCAIVARSGPCRALCSIAWLQALDQPWLAKDQEGEGLGMLTGLAVAV